MRIDPGVVSASIAGTAKAIQAQPTPAASRAIIQKKAQQADAAELGKATHKARPVDLGRTPGALKAQHRQAIAQSATPPVANTDAVRPPTEPPVTPTDSRLQDFLAAYGATKGDGRYSEKFDLDGDGVIGFADLNTLLSQPAETTQDQRVFTAADLDSLLASFNSRLGDANYNPEFDFDQDGVINFADLNRLVENLAPEAAKESPAANELTGFLGAYNRRDGQDGFDARFDYDNDGVVSFSDLNHLLDQLTNGVER